MEDDQTGELNVDDSVTEAQILKSFDADPPVEFKVNEADVKVSAMLDGLTNKYSDYINISAQNSMKIGEVLEGIPKTGWRGLPGTEETAKHFITDSDEEFDGQSYNVSHQIWENEKGQVLYSSVVINKKTGKRDIEISTKYLPVNSLSTTPDGLIAKTKNDVVVTFRPKVLKEDIQSGFARLAAAITKEDWKEKV